MSNKTSSRLAFLASASVLGALSSSIAWAADPSSVSLPTETSPPSSGPVASPATTNVERAADAAFQEGRVALARSSLIDACNKFAESDRLSPSGRAVLNLADCLERRGLIASAYTKFLDAASRAVQAKREDAERHARDRAARLEHRLSRVTLVVSKEAMAPGLEVRRDGSVVPPSQWNVPELADPGMTHLYEATAAGRLAWTASVIVEEGKTSRVELRWREDSSSPPKLMPIRERRPQNDNNALRPIAYGALGVGAAGLIVGTVAGIQVLSAKSTVDEHCNTAANARTCDREGLDAAARGSTWAIVSPTGFIVGALGVAAGTFLLLKESRDRTSYVGIAPILSPQGGGLAIRGDVL